MRRLFGTSLCVFLAGTMLVALPAQAQIDFGVDFSLLMTPAYPKPGEKVRIEARSALLDLQLGEIVWSVNGVERTRGNGLTEIELSAPPLGGETRVRAAFFEEGFERTQAESVVRPVEIDLLWESDSYTPVWYRGRALPSAGTSLRVEAVPRFERPDGTLVPNTDIVFTWKRDGYVIASASGRGKAKALLESPPLFGEDTISVEARSADGMFVGEASVEIESRDPVLSLYENHPLFGVLYHRALTADNQLPEEEVTFSAIPYFTDSKTAHGPGLTYEWRVDRNLVQNDPAKPNEITINAEGSSGVATIDLSLSQADNFFLQVANAWNIVLGRGVGLSLIHI